MKRIVVSGLIGLFSVVAISIGGLSTPAHAAIKAPIVGVGGKCLDVQGGVAVRANKVQLYSCNGTDAQVWEQNDDGTIRNQGFCLDIKQGGVKVKTAIWLYECNGSNAQKWQVNGNGAIINPTSRLCLDSRHGGSANRNPLWIYTCNQTVAQKWSMTAVQSNPVEPVTPSAAVVPRVSAAAPQVPAPSSVSEGVVKMSKSSICHAPGTTYYAQTKNYTSYDSLQACLNAGGRMPKR